MITFSYNLIKKTGYCTKSNHTFIIIIPNTLQKFFGSETFSRWLQVSNFEAMN